MKRLILLAVIILIMSAVCVSLGVQHMRTYANTPLETDARHISLTIRKGDTLFDVIATLREAGLDISSRKFRLIARYTKYDTQLHAGDFYISTGFTPIELLKYLAEGKVRLYRLTIPEGFTLSQIAGRVAALPCGIKKADFIAAAAAETWRNRLQIPTQNLEGYLFPDTYYFPLQTDADAVVSAMAHRFSSVFTDAWKQRATTIGLSPHQVVTLASIIEKETGAPEERPRIASVFHNRLKREMRLESDPTVIYGIPDFDGNITRKHLKTWTPYNTYRINGLPPGPIANPGAAALHAALYPETTEFIFFVSKQNGSHHFSKNLREHNKAVIKYQLRR
ncbi:MAG: aminodeoxychorismate lyase [Deltaproteobacteria bacterium]|nr:MAG: aminodeoxychorismate lyase [Deltaproteobacteria bacterium]